MGMKGHITTFQISLSEMKTDANNIDALFAKLKNSYLVDITQRESLYRCECHPAQEKDMLHLDSISRQAYKEMVTCNFIQNSDRRKKPVKRLRKLSTFSCKSQ